VGCPCQDAARDVPELARIVSDEPRAKLGRFDAHVVHFEMRPDAGAEQRYGISAYIGNVPRCSRGTCTPAAVEDACLHVHAGCRAREDCDLALTSLRTLDFW
jgi:hypothetical protein